METDEFNEQIDQDGVVTRIVMTKIKLDEDKRDDEVVLSPVLKMISGFTCPKCACTYADCECLYDALCKICSNYKVACVCEEAE